MAEQLQALLDRINEQGIEKAEAEKADILAQAKAEAKGLVDAAKAKAEKLVSEAESEADLLVKKGEESLKQASRKVILSLREELIARMSAVLRECLASELSGKVLAEAVETAAKAYMSAGGKAESLEVLIPESEQKDVAAHAFAALGEDLKKKPEVAPSADVSAGFRLVFDGSDAQYDFSDEALLELFQSFLNPKLAELVAGSPKE